MTDAGVKVPALKSTQSKAPNVSGSSSCEQGALCNPSPPAGCAGGAHAGTIPPGLQKDLKRVGVPGESREGEISAERTEETLHHPF